MADRKIKPGRPPARGARRRGTAAILVRWDTETFEQLAQMAAAADISLAEQVRLLVEFGLEAVQ